MSWSQALLTVALAIAAGLFLAWRGPLHERPCPGHPSGDHSFILTRDTRGLRLRCMECGCKSKGWAVFQRAEAKK